MKRARRWAMLGRRCRPRPHVALGTELGPPFKFGKGGPGGWIIPDEPEGTGGRHAWLVNPALHTLEVLRLHEGRGGSVGVGGFGAA